jgi:hypothetical protein
VNSVILVILVITVSRTRTMHRHTSTPILQKLEYGRGVMDATHVISSLDVRELSRAASFVLIPLGGGRDVIFLESNGEKVVRGQGVVTARV